MTMKKSLKILLIIVVITSIGCSNNKKNKNIIMETANISIENEGHKLIKQNCYACHSVITKSHDEIIAPPMGAIKRRYKMSYPNEEEFIIAFTNWVMDPKEENALMRGAVSQFNVMPKQPFNKEEIIKIAHYTYNNELEKPDWFQNHFKQEHSNGMGNGLRRGAGNRNRQF
jgi:hypothetical protein